MHASIRSLLAGTSVFALCASSLGIAQRPAVEPFVCAPDGSATLVLPASSASARNDEALCLFETDRGNRVLDCAEGRSGSPDPIAVTCRFEHSGFFALQTAEGPVRLHALGTRSNSEQDGTSALHEEVVLVDEAGRPVHTLVQWSQTVGAQETTLLRRRFKVVDLDGEGSDEVCVESSTEVGPGSVETRQSGRFRPTRRSSGFDAFAWDGQRLVHVETLDGRCPRTGYQLFVSMPRGSDQVAARRDQR